MLRVSLIFGIAASLAACATYDATLINDKGETIHCHASGKNGILTGNYLRKTYEDCLNSAKANGYHETPS